MSTPSQRLRQCARSAFKKIGLHQHISQNITLLDARRLKYRKIKRFETEVRSVPLSFHTDDAFSNSWFFPRYAGGGIHEKAVSEMIVDALQGAHCFVDVGAN